MALRDEEEEEEQPKEKKKLFGKKGKATELPPISSTPYDDADIEEEGGTFSIVLITFFIVLIWLAILGLLIKLDVGGFGSSVLRPILKDVPVINKILPDIEEDNIIEEASEYDSIEEAVDEIERLKRELEQSKLATPTTSDDEVTALKEEIKRLQTFEDNQVEFQKIKTEFYEEVVFAENAPDIEAYKIYYESIDPTTAEYLYKQVVQQIEANKMLDEYVQAYSQMKPKQAAAIFEQMPDNLELTAKILGAMDPDDRAKILGVMDAALASKITKIMDPDN